MQYKFDKVQVMLIILVTINLFAYMVLPFKEVIPEGIPVRGYTSILSWITIIFMVRMLLHSFGFELYNLNGAVLFLFFIYGTSFLKKYIFSSNEFESVLYSYLIITGVTTLCFIAVLYLDRLQYDVFRRTSDGKEELL